MRDKFPSDITFYGTNYGRSHTALDIESGTSTELHQREDGQVRNATGESTLLHDNFPLEKSDLSVCAFTQPDIRQYGEPVFHADVSQGIKEFQLFQLRRRSQQRRFGGFAA
jgi:hypothetical protein